MDGQKSVMIQEQYSEEHLVYLDKPKKNLLKTRKKREKNRHFLYELLKYTVA